MNFIVALCLLVMEPEETFWTLVAITETYSGSDYFDQNLSGAQADQETLKDLIHEKLPSLYAHLRSLDIDLTTVSLNWFLSLFFDALPFEVSLRTPSLLYGIPRLNLDLVISKHFQTLLRVWDTFLLEGPKVLFRYAAAILSLNEHGIRNKKETIAVLKHLKACPKLLYNADQLVQVGSTLLTTDPSNVFGANG